MNDFTFILLLPLASAALVLAALAFLKASVNAAKIELIGNAPVLRQYVERYVPIDNSEEAQKIVANKMKEMEREFEMSLGLGEAPKKPRSERAQRNILNADMLV